MFLLFAVTVNLSESYEIFFQSSNNPPLTISKAVPFQFVISFDSARKITLSPTAINCPSPYATLFKGSQRSNTFAEVFCLETLDIGLILNVLLSSIILSLPI